MSAVAGGGGGPASGGGGGSRKGGDATSRHGGGVAPASEAPGNGREEGMLPLMLRFVGELRKAGLPVAISESIDAVETLRHVGIDDREGFKAAMAATLIKNQSHYLTFETVFEVFFAIRAEEPWMEEAKRQSQQPGEMPGSGGGGGGGVDPEELIESLYRALMNADEAQMRALAQRAVAAFAGMEPGRPVGGTYYLYRTLRNVELESILRRLIEDASRDRELSPLEERLLRDEFEARVERFREEVQAEIRRRLVEDRGVEAMARTLRRPLPEEIEFMHASAHEMAELKKAIHPLTRRLAAKLSRKRRQGRFDRLDVRRTIRRSLSTGGVPADPQFRKPHPLKPEIFLVCDISGSVASFARFTLQLIHAMSSQFSRVRSWVFVDAIDEVTEFFEGTAEFGEAVHRVNTEADVIWVDGHSDYGHALKEFWDENARDVTAKSSIIILGDARNNYHASESWVLREVNRQARRLYWLNPEPRGYWDTGDSIMSDYVQYCDGVYECRNLRQLEAFVGEVI